MTDSKTFTEFNLNQRLQDALDKHVKDVKKYNDEYWFLVYGRNGTGKSTLTSQVAYYLDRTLNVDRVVFTVEDFGKQFNKLEHSQSLIYDEAAVELNSKRSMSGNAVNFQNLGITSRHKHAFIFLITPELKYIYKYGREKIKGIFYTYRDDKNRFCYKAFPASALELADKMKIKLEYCPKILTTSTFEDKVMYDLDAYNDKKERYIKTLTEKPLTKTEIRIAQTQMKVIKNLLAKGWMQKDIATILEVAPERICEIITNNPAWFDKVEIPVSACFGLNKN